MTEAAAPDRAWRSCSGEDVVARSKRCPMLAQAAVPGRDVARGVSLYDTLAQLFARAIELRVYALVSALKARDT